MWTCNKAGSRMVVDAANSNGPFQPVALLHIRGKLLCVSPNRNLPGLVNKWLLCLGSEEQEVPAGGAAASGRRPRGGAGWGWGGSAVSPRLRSASDQLLPESESRPRPGTQSSKLVFLPSAGPPLPLPEPC